MLDQYFLVHEPVQIGAKRVRTLDHCLSFLADTVRDEAGFGTPVSHAAWRDKPTCAIVATEDKSINPELEPSMYKRSNSKATEIKGSHVVFMSQPEAVSKVVIAAAGGR